MGPYPLVLLLAIKLGVFESAVLIIKLTKSKSDFTILATSILESSDTKYCGNSIGSVALIPSLVFATTGGIAPKPCSIVLTII